MQRPETRLLSDSRYQAAREQHLAGHLTQAESLYQELIPHHPQTASLRSNLGIAALQLGKLPQGIHRIRTALALDPSRPKDWLNLAQSAFMLEHPHDAVRLSTHALCLDPELAEAYALRGEGHRKLKRIPSAMRDFGITTLLHPCAPTPYNNRGMMRVELNDAPGAIGDLEKAQKIVPGSFEVNINLGNAYYEQKDFAAARVSALTARNQNTQSADPWELLGKIEISSERPKEANDALTRALILEPGKMASQLLAGLALFGQRNFKSATLAYSRAIQINPKSDESYNNLGNAALETGEQNLGLACFLRATQINPARAEYYTGMGVAYAERLDFKSAIANHLRGTQINPASIETHYNLSQAQLISGAYLDGWRNYEWRFEMDEAKYALRPFAKPRYTGQPVKGKRLYLYWEQGFGDTIQFCRYAKLLAEQDAEVTLEVQAPLKTLIESLDSRVSIMSPGDPTPEFDFHSPLLSLPHALGTTVDSIPRFPAYLSPQLRRPGEASFGPHQAGIRPYQVGLAWSGSTLFKKDHRRTLELQALRNLLSLEGVEFHCLQKEIRSEDEPLLQSLPQLTLHAHELESFNDTAWLIQEMDLVISVDTSIAHLAGAIGKPVWILLPYLPDHRWFLDRCDSPWYPSAKLFRQSEQRSWPEVLDRVVTAIKERFQA